MKTSIVASIGVLASASILSSTPEKLFEDFVTKYEKTYESEIEKATRFEIFKSRVEQMKKDQMESPELTFDVNQWTDMTLDESMEFIAGFNQVIKDEPKRELVGLPDISGYPATLDWSSCYPEVRNQKSCGSCWAFAAAATVEGAICKATGAPVKELLAPQTLVDCDKKQHGCQGASSLAEPLEHAVAEGLCYEKDLPYKARKHWFKGCLRDKGKCPSGVAKPDGSIDLIPEGKMPTVSYLVDALNRYGPVTIGVAVSNRLQAYKSGVLTKANCGSANPNHAVTLVGYERVPVTEEDADYEVEEHDSLTPRRPERGPRPEFKYIFKIRNSWGQSWGEDGYFRVQNLGCKLATAGGAAFYGDVQPFVPEQHDEKQEETSEDASVLRF